MPWIIDPVMEAYDQQNMRPHYLRCLDLGEMVPFPKASFGGGGDLTTSLKTLQQCRPSSVFAECQMTRRSMCSVVTEMVVIIQHVGAFLTVIDNNRSDNNSDTC